MYILGAAILFGCFSLSKSQEVHFSSTQEYAYSLANEDLSRISIPGCLSSNVMDWTLEEINTCTGSAINAYAEYNTWW